MKPFFAMGSTAPIRFANSFCKSMESTGSGAIDLAVP